MLMTGEVDDDRVEVQCFAITGWRCNDDNSGGAKKKEFRREQFSKVDLTPIKLPRTGILYH